MHQLPQHIHEDDEEHEREEHPVSHIAVDGKVVVHCKRA